MEPRSSKGEQTREEILGAAKELFLAQGLTATTMRQIAQAVGISPAAIYNHFPGKDAIFTTLLQVAAPYEPLFTLLRDIEAVSAEGLLSLAIRSSIEFLSHHKDYIRLALIDSQERDGATLITFLPQILPHARDLYERLINLDSSHRCLRTIPFPVFTRALVSLIAGFMMTEGVAGAPQIMQVPDTDWAQELASIFMHGVLKPTEKRGDYLDAASRGSK